MDELIKKSKELRDMIKQSNIDNPALALGILSSLDFFIVTMEDES